MRGSSKEQPLKKEDKIKEKKLVLFRIYDGGAAGI
jgi:hypothetical protein